MSAELGQFAKVQGGFAFKSKDFGSEGVPVVKIANVTGGGFVDLSSYECIPPNLYPRMDQFLTEPGDVLIAMTGANVGKVVRVGRDQPRCAINQRVGRLQLKDHCEYSKDFFYYLISSPAGYQHFIGAAYGSAQPNISGTLIEKLQVPSIPPSEANQAAGFLRKIDDKIQLNHQINQTLEQMAQAIFKSWFVDFEPVKAKIAALDAGGSEEDALLAAMQAISGKDADQLAQMQAEQPEQYAELRATAELFPSAMQDSELGEIPSTWEVGQLGDYLNTLETGGRPKGGVKGITDGVPSVGAENIIGIGNYEYGKEKFIPEEFFAKLKRGVVEHLDCLLYKDGGKPGDFKPRVSMFGCGFPYDKFAINEHVFRLRSERLGQPFLYCQIGHERVLVDLRHRGAKAAIPGINQTDVKTISIVCASAEVLDAFNRIVEGLFVSILTRSKENLRLAETRDALLPKLLSGELTLPNIKEPQTEAQEVVHV